MKVTRNSELNPFEVTEKNQNLIEPTMLPQTPSKSPSRRGIIKSETPEAPNGLSPVKTPNGRAGLASPRKRSFQELNNSARKRSSRTYSRLMEEDDVEDEDGFLRDLELQLAEEIIRESKIDTKDSEPIVMSEPPTLALPKRKRGRPTKAESAKRLGLTLEQIDLSPRRLERRVVAARKAALREAKQDEEEKKRTRTKLNYWTDEEYDLEDEENEDEKEEEDEEEEEEEPKKVKQKRVPKSKNAIKRLPIKLPVKVSSLPRQKSATPERRTKKGRPSKQENVTKIVNSIFKMDDIKFFQESINRSGKSSPVSSPQITGNYLNFNNTGDSTFSSIPTISGIGKPTKNTKEIDLDKATKFEPMPVPDVDEEGNVKDPAFLQKYFEGMELLSDTNMRLTDERAFFLEGSEGYFEQHNLRFRPSSNSLTGNAPTLTYEEFIPNVQLGTLIHSRERRALYDLHKELYHQWCFELSQGYSLNFYGVGSKRNFILDFAEGYLLDWYEKVMQVDDEFPVAMVINGYNPSTKLKTIIHEIISAVITPEFQKQHALRMPKHVSEAFPFLLSHLKQQQSVLKNNGLVRPDLILIVHNIDGDAFRDERSQNYLSQLAALENVWFITSTDNVNASLLWDLNRFKNFNFLWHDLTLYEPYSVEMSFKDVLSVGQSKKFIGSNAARIVLSSLSTNSKKLYKVLLQMQMKKLEENSTESARPGLRANIKLAVEFRSVFERCQKEFITSNEINFRNLLQEYVEHKMCTISKTSRGTEVLFVPFSFAEMKKIVDEAFGESQQR